MPHIDGLRAVAVLPVILFHMKFEWIEGGFLGVDVFFVISGFLITSIILRELREGTFSFKKFWARRVRRIFPAMLTVTICTLLFAYLFLYRGDLPGIAKQALFALLSLANVYFWRATNDYWGTDAEEAPLLHTWSLSVEEQFYLFFPVAVWLVYRYRPRWVRMFLFIVIVSSYGLFLWGAYNRPAATFFLLPTRAWELAIGAYLATIRVPSTGGSFFALLGLASTIIPIFAASRLTGWTLMPVVGSALVIRFGSSGICARVLESAPLLHIGRLSYSLYLWHWPVLVFADRLGYTGSQLLLGVPIYALSLMCYLLIECPARKSSSVVYSSLAMAFSVLLVSGLISRSSGLYDTSGFARPHWYGRFYDLQPRAQLGDAFEAIANTMNTPAREASSDSFLKAGIIAGSSNDAHPDVLLLGDSHGVMWSDAVSKACRNSGLSVSLWSMSGLKPFIDLPISAKQEAHGLTADEKRRFDEKRVEAIRRWKPVVILASRWSEVADDDVTDLLEIAAEAECSVLLLEQPPELAGVGDRSALQYACFSGIRPKARQRQYFATDRQGDVKEGLSVLQRLSRRYPNCTVVPLHSLYSQGDKALLIDGDQMVYVDDDHLTTYGASLAIPLIQEAVIDALKSH